MSKSEERRRPGGWSIVARDVDAARWALISCSCFWLRYPAALDDPQPWRPQNMTQAVDMFTRLGDELQILEWDLTECLNEFKMGHELTDREHLLLKKFRVVYHIDNFYVRVHKLRENVYCLLEATVGLDHTKKTQGEDPSRRRRLETALDRRTLRGVAKALRQFEQNRQVERAVKARNLFVHQFREEAEFPMLDAPGRVRALEKRRDDIGEQARRAKETWELDEYVDRKAEELLGALRAIQAFRDRLWWALDDEVVALLKTRSAETRKRFHGFVEWWEVLREAFPSAGSTLP